MTQSHHVFRTIEDRNIFASEFIKEFVPDGMIPLDEMDVLTTLDGCRDTNVFVAIGQSIGECVDDLSYAVSHRPHKMLLTIQCADLSAMSMDEVAPVQDFIASMPEDMDVKWGLAQWADPIDNYRIAMILL